MFEEKNQATLPNSIEAEMMVLGCMMSHIDDLNLAIDVLDQSFFYYEKNQIVFSALKWCYKEDKAAEVNILAEYLRSEGKLKEIGGHVYLMDLVQFSGVGASIEDYCEIVKNKALLRKLHFAGISIAKFALTDPLNVQLAIEDAQKMIFEISQYSGRKTGKLVSEIVDGTASKYGKSLIELVEERQQKLKDFGIEKGVISGISSGLIDLDKILNGFQKTNFMVLAARPAMGKTALAINIAENVCYKSKLPVGVFSLEMDADQLVTRMAASLSGVDAKKIMGNLPLTPEEFQNFVEAAYEMKTVPMVIDDQPGLRITDLRTRAKRMKESRGIELLVIDYLQLLSGSGSKIGSENRQAEISEISRMLKNLAKELDIPILCLSQLSREVEKRGGNIPMLSDLRESGAIEQDADIVMFIHRKEYYDNKNKPGEADVIVAKNRHGEIGIATLCFQKQIAKFVNIEKWRKEAHYDEDE